MRKMFTYSLEQARRTDRARAAIQAGTMQLTRIAPAQWVVGSCSGPPCVVTLRSIPDPYFGSMWSCTCPDYQKEGPLIHCMHIEGVRLLEAALESSARWAYQEKVLKDGASAVPEECGNDSQRILWELQQPLDMSRVKRRQAPGVGSVPYLEGHDVIERANQIFRFGWSFDILSQPVIVRWQCPLTTWSQKERRRIPAVDDSGAALSEETGLVYLTGKVTVDLGGRICSHADLGRCVFRGNAPESLDTALAASATDCLKRCFRHLGDQFGNLLYDKEVAHGARLDANLAAAETVPFNQVTADTPADPGIDVRRYGDGTGVNGSASERAAYDRYLKETGSIPATKDILRGWVTGQRSLAAAVSSAA